MNICAGQDLPQSFDLGSKLPDEFDIDIFVDGRFVDDVLGSVGVSQCGQRLTVIDLFKKKKPQLPLL